MRSGEFHTKAGASAVVSLHGGQLLSWRPLPYVEEQLYLSELAVMDGSSGCCQINLGIEL